MFDTSVLTFSLFFLMWHQSQLWGMARMPFNLRDKVNAANKPAGSAPAAPKPMSWSGKIGAGLGLAGSKISNLIFV